MPLERVGEVSNIYRIQRNATKIRINVTVSDSIYVIGSTEKRPYLTIHTTFHYSKP